MFNKFKNILFSFILLVLSVQLSAQATRKWSGQVVDSVGRGLVGASVMLNSKQDSSVLAYVITAGQGRFTLESEVENWPAGFITIAYMGFKSVDLSLDKLPEQGRVVLSEDALATKEILIVADAAPVVRKGDTTDFNLKKFADGSEKKIEDLLKKLPGFTVDANGAIKYQGKDVSQVKLDGDNLLGGNYTFGTKNLNADLFETVQVFEHHSDNVALRKVERSDDIAVNLKLTKEAKLSLLFQLDGHTGFSTTEWKRDLSATGLSLSKFYKSLLIGNLNNTGNRLENIEDFALQYGNGLTNKWFTPSITAPLTSATPVSNVNVAPIINFRNNDNFINWNNIFALTENHKLRAQVIRQDGRNKVDANQNSLFLGGANGVQQYTQTSNYQRDSRTNIELSSELMNSKRNFYMKSIAYYAYVDKWATERVNRTTNSRPTSFEGVLGSDNRVLWLATELTRSFGQTSALVFSARYRNEQEPETLTSSQITDATQTDYNQLIDKKSEGFNAELTYFKNFKKLFWRTQLAYENLDNRLTSKLTDGATYYHNNTAVLAPKVYNTHFVGFRWGQFQIKSTLGLSKYFIENKDFGNSTALDNKGFMPSYGLSTSYDSKGFDASIDYRYQEIPVFSNYLYVNTLLVSLQNFGSNALTAGSAKSHNLSGGVSYTSNNGLTQFGGRASYAKSLNADLITTNIVNDTVRITRQLGGGTNDNISLQTNFSRLFSKLNMKLDVEADFRQSNNTNVFNNVYQVSTNTSKGVKLNLASTFLKSWFNFSTEQRLTQQNQNNNENNTGFTTYQSQYVVLAKFKSIYIKNLLTIHALYQSQSPTLFNSFLSFELSYDLPSKSKHVKTIRFDCLNLLDNRAYNSRTQFTNQVSSRELTLNGRTFLFGLDFTF